ncbi:MAG: hypothetical protein Q9188_006060 [Gyalolechia gomerana]
MDLSRETGFGRVVYLRIGGKFSAYDERSDLLVIQGLHPLDLQASANTPYLGRRHSETSVEALSTGIKQDPDQGSSMPNDLEKDDDYALVEWMLTDSDNPRNWSRLKKAFVTFQFCLLTTSVYIEAGLPSIQTRFHISTVKALLGLTLFVIGYALDLLAPKLEIPYIDRNPEDIGTLFAFVLLQPPIIYASNASIPFAFRFMTGLVGSPVLATGGATIADMDEPKKQAYGIGVRVIAAAVGPAVGSLIGGLAVEAHGWERTIWELMWLSGFFPLVLFFFLPQTSSSNIL